MSSLFVWKEQLQNLYAKHSRYVDKALQFILALATFMLINHNVGFMKTAASPLVTIALAVICTFPPMTLMVIAALILTLLHMYAASLGVAIVMAVTFLVMFIFYFRFTPKRSLVILLTLLSFVLKIPFVIPIIFGLIGAPIYIIPVACGTITFYMIDYVKSNVTAITSASGLMGQLTAFAQQVFQNKIMWITVAVFTICLFTVYAIRKLSINNAWIIAILSGAAVNVIGMVVGDVMLDVHISYVGLIMGSLTAILISLVLEFFVFTVDYTRTEHLQYEDDEYYYYVKAVPKISVAAPEVTVKKINERQETVVIDTDSVKKGVAASVPQKSMEHSAAQAEQNSKKSGGQNQKAPARRLSDNFGEEMDLSKTDEMLLAKSLRDELDIQKIVEKELKK